MSYINTQLNLGIQRHLPRESNQNPIEYFCRAQLDLLKSRNTSEAIASYAAVLTIVSSATAHSHSTEQMRPRHPRNPMCKTTSVQALSRDEHQSACHADCASLRGLLHCEV